MRDYTNQNYKKEAEVVTAARGRNKYPIIFFIAALALLAVGIFYFNKTRNDSSGTASPSSNQEESKPIEEKAESINGLMVRPEEVKRPFAVIVENHVDSRPQSGLSQADIVYEALAEGGITRFMAVYQTEKVDSIGPVRSARTYFNAWASELGAVYAHVGGNSDALTEIKQGIAGFSDADQFFNDKYFIRSSSRPAPHNVYTSTKMLNDLAEAKGFSVKKNYTDYKFKDDQAQANPAASDIKIQFSTANFAVGYKYDQATNSYKRLMAGSPAIDKGNNQQVTAKNVIVQVVPNFPVQSDTPLAIGMNTKGSGTAYVFTDGNVVKGTWKYQNGRTRFYDSSGKEVALNRGKTWIEVIPPDMEAQMRYTGAQAVSQ